MKRNKFVIIGLGNIGLELLKKLSKDFEIVCIDLKKEAVEKAQGIRSDCTFITGDASSRLVLEKAGVSEVDGVIITTTSEEVNIETARILKEHFYVKNIIAIGTTQTGIEALTSLGVEVENIFTASATVIRNRLEQTSRTAHAIGLGKNEILEVEVHPHSRLANRPLKTLTPIRWRIGIIYRDDNIIIPGSDTVLKPKDRVIILGEPNVLKTVSEILTFRFEQFPLEYGSTVIAIVTGKEDDSFFKELNYLFSILPLKNMIVLLFKKAVKKEAEILKHIKKDNIQNLEIKKSILPMLPSIIQTFEDAKKDQGMIVVSRKAIFKSLLPFFFSIKKKKFLNNLLKEAICPVLISAGTFPYEKTLVPCVEGIHLQHSLETALEISPALNNEVTASVVKPSKYISSDQDIKSFESFKKTINDIGLMYKSSIKTQLLDGNPVKLITSSLNNYNLLIAEPYIWKIQKRFTSIINPDILWYIIKDSKISTLLLPHVEEAL
jgi:hypothetical protein